MMKLRPYQQEAREAVHAEWKSGKAKTLLVLPTGTGKTVVFAAICDDVLREGGRVLILAHRGELLSQAADKIYKLTGLKCSVEKAEQHSIDSWRRITVGSVQTLMRAQRLAQFSQDYFSMIVIDEAHHSISDSYRVILNYFSEAKVLGVTATPDRGDMRNLSAVFDSIAYEYTLPQAIKDGYLVPIKALTVPLKIDMRSVGISAGDYRLGDIATALDPYLESIASMMQKYCRNRKTVVFLPLVKTSQKFCGILNSHGFKAAEVNGESENRETILADFEAGKYNVLCNSMLLTEGWDCPSVDCVVVLRSTKVRALYCQMVGRGTRLSPNKKDLLLLDFLWNTERHELCRPACLVAEDREVSEKMTANLEASAGAAAADITEAEQTASQEVVEEREAALAKQLDKMKKRKGNLVDPVQFAMSVQSAELSSYVPAFGYERQPVTEKSGNALEKRGIDPSAVNSEGMAEKILKICEKRQNAGLATPKQIRCLERYGFKHVGTWTFDDANKMISRIAAQGWRRVPPNISAENYTPNTT